MSLTVATIDGGVPATKLAGTTVDRRSGGGVVVLRVPDPGWSVGPGEPDREAPRSGADSGGGSGTGRSWVGPAANGQFAGRCGSRPCSRCRVPWMSVRSRRCWRSCGVFATRRWCCSCSRAAFVPERRRAAVGGPGLRPPGRPPPRGPHTEGAPARNPRHERVVDLHEPEALAAVSAYVMSERPDDAETTLVFLIGGRGRRRLSRWATTAWCGCHPGLRGRNPRALRPPHALRHTHATRMGRRGCGS